MYLLKTHVVDDLGLKNALLAFVTDWKRPGVEVGLKLRFAQLSKTFRPRLPDCAATYCNALSTQESTEISIP